MRTRIKFCGMTRIADVRLAVELGVDGIGLIFVPGSKRALTIAQARLLVAAVPPLVSVVGLFADASIADISAVCAAIRIDLLQFHGSESNAQCAVHGRPFVKAVAMGDDASPADLCSWPDAIALVLDGHRSGGLGGQGQRFDWSRSIARPEQPLIVAGGLDADNVGEAVTRLRPYAVDVSSGIECAPGIKDAQRMKAFISEVNSVDRQLA